MRPMGRLWLVTGGAGLIGSSIGRALLARGDRVRVLDKFSSGRRENVQDLAGVELLGGDILDDAALGAAVRGVSLIFHQAAISSVPLSVADPLSSNETNATGTLKVPQAARQPGPRRVVYAASSVAYGDTPTLPKVETMAPAPLPPIAVAQPAVERSGQPL